MKKISKLLSLLMCVMVMVAYGVPVLADSGDVTASGSCGDNATWTLYSTGQLKISGSGEMTNYDADGSTTSAPWGEYSSSITSVVIDDGITTIGAYAFYKTATSSLTIGTGVKTICADAFYECSNLEKFTIPENVSKIEDNAFGKIATQITKGGRVTVKSNDVNYALTAFSANGRRGTLTLVCSPSSTTRKYVDTYTSYNLAWECLEHDWNTEYSQDKQAFDDAWGIQSIHCKACDAKKSGTEESTLPYEGWSHYAIDKDNNVKWFINNGNLVISSVDENPSAIADYTSGTSAPWADYADEVTSITIDQSIRQIGGRAFVQFKKLESVTIPYGVTEIGKSAFAECSSLKNVELPETLTTIGARAFYNCKALGDITLSKNVEAVEDQAFEYDTNMKKVYVESNTTTFGTNVFDRDDSMVSTYGKLTIVADPQSTAKTYADANSKFINFECKDGTHVWSDEYTVDKKATCTAEGSESKHCTVCGASDESSAKSISKTNHNWKHVKNAAGYLKNGSEYDICTVCGTKNNVKTLSGYSKYAVKKFKVKKGKKCFTATWAKASKANQKLMTGYQIRYSQKSNMSGAKYATASKTSKSKKIKKLSKKKKYYVQVRTYMKKSGKTYYSKWSSKKTVKTK